MQSPVPGVGVRLVPLGVVAGAVLGAATGARSLVGDVAGLWSTGLLFGAVAGAVMGGVAAALSAAVVTPRALAAPVSLWWQLLVPVPAAAGLAWWVLQSPSVHVLDRVVLTAAVAAACAVLVVATSRWVLAPMTAARGGTLVAPASR